MSGNFIFGNGVFVIKLMRERLLSFMQGRYGIDALSKVLIGAALICGILSLLLGNVFYILGVCLVGYAYFRMFSTNYEKRYKENRAFIHVKNRAMAFLRNQKNVMQQRKHYRIYTCAQCKQKIRIPKGHGKIVVTCPKCKFEFQKRS